MVEGGNDAAQARPRSGCLTGVLVVGGIFFAMLVAGVIALVVFLRSSTGQKVAGAVGKGVKMTLAAQTAPGAREIAKVGCSPGMVMDAEETWEFSRSFLPDAGTEKPQMAFRAMVLCSVDFLHDAPSCDAVKDAYLGAVPVPEEPFLVKVQKVGDTKARCMRIYDPTGDLLREIDAGAR